jgi:hypothetical protein
VAELEELLRDALAEIDITAADRESLEAIGAIFPQGQTLPRRALESADITSLKTASLERHVRRASARGMTKGEVDT